MPITHAASRKREGEVQMGCQALPAPSFHHFDRVHATDAPIPDEGDTPHEFIKLRKDFYCSQGNFSYYRNPPDKSSDVLVHERLL